MLDCGQDEGIAMTSEVEAEPPVVDYPLYLGWGNFIFRLRDRGIAPGSEGLRFTREGRKLFRPYSDIAEVNLSMSPVYRSAPTAQTSVRFTDGTVMRITNTNSWGTADAGQTQDYYRFKADFHRRLLANSAAARIRFTTGVSSGRSRLQKVVIAIAAAFFIGGPILIFILSREPQALLILVGGAAFVLPFYRAIQRNRPRSYDPASPPDMLA